MADFDANLRRVGAVEEDALEIEWATELDKNYVVESREHLSSGDWVAVDGGEIAGDGSKRTLHLGSFAGVEQMFFRVREVGSPAVSVVLGVVVPSLANLVEGATGQFSVTFPDGGNAQWRVIGFDSADNGTISSSGLYQAPVSAPELPFLLIVASNENNPDELGLSTLTILGSGDTPFISRDQAVGIVLEDVIGGHADASEMVVFATQEPLEDRGRIFAVDFDPTQTTTGNTQACWFFLLDLEPLKAWSHRVQYVFVDCQTGAILEQRDETWFPLLNGAPLWSTFEERIRGTDRVYVGSEIASVLEAERAPSVLSASTDEVDWSAMFPFSESACPCDDPKRYAIVIGNDKPTDSAFLNGVSAIGGFFTGASSEDRIRNGANITKEILQNSGFEVTSLIGAINVSGTSIGEAFSSVRKKVRPCDVFFVYIASHGSKSGAGGIGYETYRDLFAGVPTHAKYMVIDSCFSGNILDRMNEGTRVLLSEDTAMTGFVISSTDADTAANVLYDEDTYDADGRKPLAFSNAFFHCMETESDFSGLADCANDFDDKVADNDPLYQAFTRTDSDQDGLTNQMENAIGLDPNNTDTDGDGVCDGIEFAYVPIGNGGNLRLKKIRFERAGRLATSINTAYSVRFRTQEEADVEDGSDDPEDANYVEAHLKIVYNDNPPSETNPFGRGPNSGWVKKSGNLPDGITIDRDGALSGTAAEKGEFTFTLEYTDPLGRKAEVTRRLYVLEYPEQESTVDVSTRADGNVRDDDISFREAVMLANGELTFLDLRPDPDPDNGKGEGERRWVIGDVSVGPVNIHLNRSFDPEDDVFHIGSPIILTADETNIFSQVEIIRGTVGPLIEFRGNNNVMNNIIYMEVSSGPAILISGTGNIVGSFRSHFQSSAFTVDGAGSGDGIVITGSGNSVGGAIVRGFENGVRLTDTAESNRLRYLRLMENTNGLMIDGAMENEILDCRIGYRLDDEDTVNFLPIEGPNTGYGVVISGGAQGNYLGTCGIGANQMGGVLITGGETEGNRLFDCDVGHDQTLNSPTERLVTKNGGPGVTISDGASSNMIAEGLISNNNGHGIFITGEDTDGNVIGHGGCDLIEFDMSEGGFDAIHLTGGTDSNRITAEILNCSGNGIAISGENTRFNVIDYLFGGESCSFNRRTSIENCALAGILLSDGAEDNVVGTDSFNRVTVSNCAVGIKIANAHGNSLIQVSVTENAGHGIEISGGSSDNILLKGVTSDGNGGSGVFLSGSGTELNRLVDLNALVRSSSFFPANQRYGVEIVNGAQYNAMEGVLIYKHVLGGVLIDGENTLGNVVNNCTIQGVLFGDASGTGSGVEISGGASGNKVVCSSVQYSGGLAGVYLHGEGTRDNSVLDNLIRLNEGDGVLIDGAVNNHIGDEAGTENRIGDNDLNGIRISGSSASGNSVLGNMIGNGSFFPANAGHGILVENGAHDNVLGGVRPLAYSDTSSEVRLPADPDEVGFGNLIIGNGGDGIRIDGAHRNFVAGNQIGAPETTKSFANAGHGIAIINGAQDNRIGNCFDDQNRNLGFSNYITLNGGDAIHLDGGATSGNTLRQNELVGNLGGLIVVQNGANGGLAPIFVGRDGIAGNIFGTAPSNGIIDIHSDFVDDVGVYHLTAAVRAGGFEVDLFKPETDSINAVLMDKGQGLRNGTILITFTERSTGNTTAYAVIE